MTNTTLVMHVELHSKGYRQLIARRVDTSAQAQAFANAGHAQDALEGTQTNYQLFTWETLTDRSNLVSVVELN